MTAAGLKRHRIRLLTREAWLELGTASFIYLAHMPPHCHACTGTLKQDGTLPYLALNKSHNLLHGKTFRFLVPFSDFWAVLAKITLAIMKKKSRWLKLDSEPDFTRYTFCIAGKAQV